MMPTVTDAQDPGAEIARLKGRLGQLASLMEVSVLIGSSLELTQVLNQVMEKAKAVMNAEVASILLWNECTNKLEFEVAVGESNLPVEILRTKIELDLGQGIAGAVAVSRVPELIPDAWEDPRFYRDADKATGFRTRTMLAAPLVVRDRLIGVAEVINRQGGGSFTAEELDLFATYCRQAAVAVQNARLHTVLLERQRAQQELEFAAMVQQSFLPEHCPV